jgi:hypothetical protein
MKLRACLVFQALLALAMPVAAELEWAEEYRVKDYATLTSPEFREFVLNQGFELLDMHGFLRLVRARS